MFVLLEIHSIIKPDSFKKTIMPLRKSHYNWTTIEIEYKFENMSIYNT